MIARIRDWLARLRSDPHALARAWDRLQQIIRIGLFAIAGRLGFSGETTEIAAGVIIGALTGLWWLWWDVTWTDPENDEPDETDEAGA